MLTQADVRELVNYNPDTGLFTRAKKTNNCANVGDIAGGPAPGGYIRLRVGGKMYAAHRLAFTYMLGSVPAVVDHINGIRTDNRWINLRAANASVNAQNRQDTPSGANPKLGVSWSRSKQKWHARIRVGGKLLHLGYFQDSDEAHASYLTAKRRLHAGCTI